jgi:hypothetical protein
MEAIGVEILERALVRSELLGVTRLLFMILFDYQDRTG